jgi:inner membrane protein involved in colicin E2 resistance
MRNKPSDEFEAFDKVMDGLLSVPYSELQRKLEEEKQAKAKQKEKRATSPASSRASSSLKKRVA